MVRRLLFAVVLFVGLAGISWAQPSASFILTNGQRHSGTLIYGRGDNNIVDLRFHVNVSGTDTPIPMNSVAAIDFVGGTPSAAELNALPNASSPGVMVMRDGSKINGHLHNIITGDMVQWVNESGQRNNYPISSVSRLYLNPAAARAAYGQGGATGTTGVQAGGAIHVPGNRAWTPTGITVQKGQTITFSSSGSVQLSQDPNDQASVAGKPASPATARAPMPGTLRGALIGRIGNGKPFGIGNMTSITAPASGPLYLGINDDMLADNSGEFVVTVSGGQAGVTGGMRR